MMLISFITSTIVFLFTAPVIGGITNGIIGNQADRALQDLIPDIYDHIKSNHIKAKLPKNNDLQKSLRKAYLQATLTVCYEYLKRFEKDNNSNVFFDLIKHIKPYTQNYNCSSYQFKDRAPECNAISTVCDLIENELKQIPSSAYIPPNSPLEGEFELLFLSRTTSAGSVFKELREIMLQNVINELIKQRDDLPDSFVSMLKNGYANGHEQIDWFELVCGYFVHELKKNEKAQNLLTNTLLAELNVSNKKITAEILQNEWMRKGELILERIDNIDKSLNSIKETNHNHFLILENKVDDFLPYLTVIPEIIDKHDNILSVLKQITDVIRRQQLADQFGNLEVYDRVEEIIKEKVKLYVQRDESLYIDNLIKDIKKGVIVLTASAGYGKTALLADWVERRLNNGLPTVYHFFSQKYDATRTVKSAYLNILKQILIYRDLVDVSLPSDLRMLRDGIYANIPKYVSDFKKPLVIVIDALDEADDIIEPFFSKELPDNVYIIVSGRASKDEEPSYLIEWLKCGTRLHLENLSKESVVEWVRRTNGGNLAAYATDSNFIEKLIEVTGSFPLYLNFLFDEMVESKKNGKDVYSLLQSCPKGFNLYVKEQFKKIVNIEECKETWVQQLFSVLTVAQGGMTEYDLFTLCDIDKWKLERLPFNISRWFSVWESREGNLYYSFVHPLLANEFATIIGSKKDMLNKVINYCSNWKTHLGKSNYALCYYAKHLNEAFELEKCVSVFEQVFELVRDSTYYEAQKLYMNNEPDLPQKIAKLALANAIRIDNGALIIEFSHIYIMRVLEMGLNKSPLEAFNSGNIEEAHYLISLYDEESSMLWQLFFAHEFMKNGEIQRSSEILENLANEEHPFLEWQGAMIGATLLSSLTNINTNAYDKLSKKLFDDGDKLYLCKRLVDCSELEKATQLMEMIIHDDLSDEAAKYIASAYLKEGNYEAVLRISTYFSSWVDNDKQKSLAVSKVKNGKYKEAIKIAKSIDSIYSRVESLCLIAIEMINNKERDRGITIFELASKEIYNSSRTNDILLKLEYASISLMIINMQIRVGEIEVAKRNLTKVFDYAMESNLEYYLRVKLLSAIGATIVRLGDHDWMQEVIKIMRIISQEDQDPYITLGSRYRIEGLLNITNVYLDREEFDKALEMVSNANNEIEQLNILIKVIEKIIIGRKYNSVEQYQSIFFQVIERIYRSNAKSNRVEEEKAKMFAAIFRFAGSYNIPKPNKERSLIDNLIKTLNTGGIKCTVDNIEELLRSLFDGSVPVESDILYIKIMLQSAELYLFRNNAHLAKTITDDAYVRFSDLVLKEVQDSFDKDSTYLEYIKIFDLLIKLYNSLDDIESRYKVLKLTNKIIEKIEELNTRNYIRIHRFHLAYLASIVLKAEDQDLFSQVVKCIRRNGEQILTLVYLVVFHMQRKESQEALQFFDNAIELVFKADKDNVIDLMLEYIIYILLGRPIDELAILRLRIEWDFVEYGNITDEDNIFSFVYDIEGDEQCKASLVQLAKKAALKIREEKIRSNYLAYIAILQAQLGMGKETVETASLILSRQHVFIPVITKALALIGEKEQFMKLLLSLNNPITIYKACRWIIVMYPDQIDEIKGVAEKYSKNM